MFWYNQAMSLMQRKIRSPLGDLYLTASENGLRRVAFSSELTTGGSVSSAAQKILDQAASELGEYFAGERERFNVALDLRGTDFQRKVWRELLKIPFGSTEAYADIARRIRNPRAVRAVGSANGKNPLCIIVPCHRVIASNGGIGGYSGGLAVKRYLLELEGVSCA